MRYLLGILPDYCGMPIILLVHTCWKEIKNRTIMLYTFEMLKKIGYETQEQINKFIEEFVNKHGNCTINVCSNGVFLLYDTYTSYVTNNVGYIVDIDG